LSLTRPCRKQSAPRVRTAGRTSGKSFVVSDMAGHNIRWTGVSGTRRTSLVLRRGATTARSGPPVPSPRWWSVRSAVLQPVAPGERRLVEALQAESVAEAGREPPAVFAGRDGDVDAVLEGQKVEANGGLAGIEEPELADAGAGVERRQPLEILADRAVADDLDDQVHRPFEGEDAVLTLAPKGGNEPHAAALDRLPKNGEHVRLRRDACKGRPEPATIRLHGPSSTERAPSPSERALSSNERAPSPNERALSSNERVERLRS